MKALIQFMFNFFILIAVAAIFMGVLSYNLFLVNIGFVIILLIFITGKLLGNKFLQNEDEMTYDKW